ncbi:MAG: CopG family transcriptional regulator [Thermoleophilia bacterium]
MTITLSAERQQALKEAAARRGTTITAIIDQSLELAGIRTRERAADIVARARAKARMGEQEAMDLAVRETAAARERAVARRPSTARGSGGR